MEDEFGDIFEDEAERTIVAEEPCEMVSIKVFVAII